MKNILIIILTVLLTTIIVYASNPNLGQFTITAQSGRDINIQRFMTYVLKKTCLNLWICQITGTTEVL